MQLINKENNNKEIDFHFKKLYKSSTSITHARSKTCKQ